MSTVTLISDPTITVGTGTNVVYTPQGPNAAGVNVLLALGDTSFTTRRQVLVRSKMPTPSKTSPGGYSHFRGYATLHFPMVASDGRLTINKAVIEVAYCPEATATDVLMMRKMAAQTLVTSAFTDFWTTGSVAL